MPSAKRSIPASASPGCGRYWKERCPYALAARPVFVSSVQLMRMSAIVAAIESVVALPLIVTSCCPVRPASRATRLVHAACFTDMTSMSRHPRWGSSKSIPTPVAPCSMRCLRARSDCMLPVDPAPAPACRYGRCIRSAHHRHVPTRVAAERPGRPTAHDRHRGRTARSAIPVPGIPAVPTTP